MRDFRQRRSTFEPAYRRTHSRASLHGRVEQALECLQACRLCPRACGVDRVGAERGHCQVGRRAKVSCAFPHYGEEGVIRGSRGSGTVFFTQCNLHCVFCQNYATSHGQDGRELTAEELGGLFLRLQAMGCHNLNLVTPSHVVPQILEALQWAVEDGFSVPLVYNTSGYDCRETLELLEGVVDIYMPDFKLWSSTAADRFLQARDYPAVAREAVAAMHRQVGDLVVDEDGLALRGLLVRHLVMPGRLADTRAIVNYLAREISPHTYVNLMDQYHPAGQVPGDPRYSAINRTVGPAEFDRAVALARKAGLWRLDPWPEAGPVGETG